MELKGKRVIFLGDSITEGAGVTDIANCRYDNRLKKMCGMAEVYNYGIGGTRLAYQSTPSESPAHDLYFCGRMFKMVKDVDLVVVYGGVNDYLHGDAPIGEYGDNTPSTFCGAVRYLMTNLKERYPNSQIAFLTPAHCCRPIGSDKYPSPRPMKRPDAQPLVFYVETIERTAKELGIPVFNMFENLGLDPNDEEIREKYTVDGLHFNDDGHAIIAEKVKAFLESI